MEGKTALVLELNPRDEVGKAILHRLTSEGWQCVTNVNESLLDRLLESNDHINETNLIHSEIDLTDRDSIIGGVSEVVSDYGSVDLLVVHSRSDREKGLAELRPSDWQETLSTSLLGPFYAFQEVAPHMKGEGQGRIISITSSSAISKHEENNLLSSTASAALKRLTESVARELYPEVTVNTILVDDITPPGEDTTIRTREGSSGPKRKPLRPEDVAETTLYLARRTNVITGRTITLTPGVQTS